MKYPNACKGIQKIFYSVILEIAILVLSIVCLVFLSAMAVSAADTGAAAGSFVSLILMSVLAVISLGIYLAGLIQAKREEHEFRLALIMTVIALALQIIASLIITANPVVSEWIELGVKFLELVAFEGVVGGIVNIAKKLGDEKIISIGRIMRVLVTLIRVSVIAAKVLEFISGDASETVKIVLELLETVDHIFYLILLVKARKMLAAA